MANNKSKIIFVCGGHWNFHCIFLC